MTGETTVWRHHWSDDARIAIAVAGAGPDEIRYEDHLTDGGEVVPFRLRFPYAALDRLLSTVDGPAGATAVDRLGGALVARADGATPWSRSSWTALRAMLTDAGVPFETLWPQGNTERCVTLRRPAHPVTGHVGEVIVRFNLKPTAARAGVIVEELYLRAEELFAGFAFHAFADRYDVLGRPPLPGASADDLCPGAEVVFDERQAALAGAIRRLLDGDGTGGYGPPPGEVRETAMRWLADAGATVTATMHDRHWTVVRAPVPGTGEELFLHVVVGIGATARFRFIERYRRPDDRHSSGTYRADTRPGVVDILAAAVDVPGADALAPADRLFAWVAHLAATGAIGPHLPRGGNAALVAGLIPAGCAPVPVEPPERPQRDVEVWHVYRERTGCHTSLTLTFRAKPGRDGSRITLTESWEYTRRSGDGGGEYLYSVSTPYQHLRRLADFLASRAGRPPAPPDAADEALQDLVGACLRTLVGRGQPEIRAGRDRVRDLFVEAGLPASVEDGAWISPD